MRLGFRRLQQRLRRVLSPPLAESLDRGVLPVLARAIVTTRPDEMGCDECFQRLDRYVELLATGQNAAAAMPLVRDHLERCRDCGEEFEALARALRALP